MNETTALQAQPRWFRNSAAKFTLADPSAEFSILLSLGAAGLWAWFCRFLRLPGESIWGWTLPSSAPFWDKLNNTQRVQVEESIIIYFTGLSKLLFNLFCLNLSQCLKWKWSFKRGQCFWFRKTSDYLSFLYLLRACMLHLGGEQQDSPEMVLWISPVQFCLHWNCGFQQK